MLHGELKDVICSPSLYRNLVCISVHSRISSAFQCLPPSGRALPHSMSDSTFFNRGPVSPTFDDFVKNLGLIEGRLSASGNKFGKVSVS